MVDVLGLIFPKEKKFYRMLEEQVENVLETTSLFYDLVTTSKNRKSRVLKIQKKERDGDKIYDKVVEELKATFITPMDREDIHRLLGRMDDIVDQLEIRALKIAAFKVKKFPKDFLDLVNIFKGQIKDLSFCIYGLGKKKDIEKYVVSVHQAERKADEVFIGGIAKLFTGGNDVMEVVKLKDLYESMEKTIDTTYSVVGIIENLAVKYA
jgi:uncharacterized protein